VRHLARRYDSPGQHAYRRAQLVLVRVVGEFGRAHAEGFGEPACSRDPRLVVPTLDAIDGGLGHARQLRQLGLPTTTDSTTARQSRADPILANTCPLSSGTLAHPPAVAAGRAGA